MNIVIVIAIIIQAVIAKASRILGAILGYLITTGIFLWGLSVYRDGQMITFWGIPLSQTVFWILCLGWYAFNTHELIQAKTEQKGIEVSKESHSRYLRNQKNPSNNNQISATIAKIAEASGDKAIDEIIGIIEDQTYDDAVRLPAITYLLKYRTIYKERVTQTLGRALLKDPSSKIRSAAAIALSNVSSPEVLLPLRAALKDDDQQVKLSVSAALDKLGRTGISEENGSTQKDDYPNDKQSISTALEKEEESFQAKALFDSQQCKAYKDGRCVVRGKDTGPCSWNPKNWRDCNVVKENLRYYGTW